MAKTIPIFRAASGINNKIDPVRLAFDPETGVTEFAAAVNVDIDRTGRPSRRKGYARALTGAWHSLFNNGGAFALGVSGAGLYAIHPDYSKELIAAVTAGLKVSYVRIADQVFWANGKEKGIIANLRNAPWVAGEYIGPETTKTFYDPPAGHLLEVYAGRMYVAKENIVWASRPFAYGQFDLARDWVPFAGRIRMMRAVSAGLFVSDDREIVFLAGSGPKDFIPRRVASYPALEGTDVRVEAEKLGLDAAGEAIVFTSTGGICLGGSDGFFKNLTEERLALPAGISRGAAGIVNGRYIVTIEP